MFKTKNTEWLHSNYKWFRFNVKVNGSIRRLTEALKNQVNPFKRLNDALNEFGAFSSKEEA